VAEASGEACCELQWQRECAGRNAMNAEQASKRTMRRSTRPPFRGKLIRLGNRAGYAPDVFNGLKMRCPLPRPKLAPSSHELQRCAVL
jgi:hypothetical protein